MSYRGIGGHYFHDKGAFVTRGEHLLDEEYPCEFGEPAVLLGTGTTRVPQNKRYVKSYDAVAGAEETIGVFIEWREAISTWTADDFALRGTKDMKRDISILTKGGCSIKNIGSGDIEIGDTVIPANGGCEKMATSGQRSLGKALQRIPSLARGLVHVNPDYEKPEI